MEFSRLLKARRMHRHFLPDPLPPETVARIAEAALRAPSAGFTQGTRLLVLSEPESLELFWAAIASPEWLAAPSRAGLANAPCVMVPLQNREAYLSRYQAQDKSYAGIDAPEDFAAPYWTVDAAFAAMLVQLAAIDAGLGCLFFGLPLGVSAMKSAFGIPAGLEPIGAIAIGNPGSPATSPSAVRRGRLPADAVIRYNRF
ncbi:MAG: nitroreductase family protein [Actinomycetota bacterium]|nr:nitroreductase family protein [Actinomycetota bacterium]MDA8208127.1 nitroreductase family protein [Actinomycetota bacterium]